MFQSCLPAFLLQLWNRRIEFLSSPADTSILRTVRTTRSDNFTAHTHLLLMLSIYVSSYLRSLFLFKALPSPFRDSQRRRVLLYNYVRRAIIMWSCKQRNSKQVNFLILKIYPLWRDRAHSRTLETWRSLCWLLRIQRWTRHGKVQPSSLTSFSCMISTYLQVLLASTLALKCLIVLSRLYRSSESLDLRDDCRTLTWHSGFFFRVTYGHCADSPQS